MQGVTLILQKEYVNILSYIHYPKCLALQVFRFHFFFKILGCLHIHKDILGRGPKSKHIAI